MGFSYILTNEGDIMNDDLDIFFDSSSGANYLESIIKSRLHLEQLSGMTDLKDKLDKLIELELDLAIAGAEKATSEAKKATAKVTPLKGV